jgi:hypothetical protein
MRSDGIRKHLVVAFLFAALLYVAGFTLDQHLRTRRGPWEITFTREPSGDPALVVQQPRLGIHDVKIVFAAESASHRVETVAFDRPAKALPFGRVKFDDLTVLPGTVTLEFAGHEVELLPRTLYLNRRPHSWQNGTTIILKPENKLPAAAEPDTGRRP